MSLFPPSRSITLAAALRDLAGGSPRARAFAAHALGELDTGEPTDKDRAVTALVAALRDDRAEVRAEAASSLGALEAHAAVAALADRLGDGDAAVRQNAAIALGTIADPSGFAPLAAALADGPADVRFQAATSLAEIDPALAYDPLIAATDDRDPLVVAAAALALGAIGDGRAVARLVALVEHSQPAVRFDAAYALAELHDPRGKDVLAKYLDDGERAWDAVTALEWLGDPVPLTPLLTMRKAPPEAQLLAAGAMLRLGADEPTAKHLLVAALGARKPNLRGLAIEQLATAGGEWAIAPLEAVRRGSKGRPFAAEIDDTLIALRK